MQTTPTTTVQGALADLQQALAAIEVLRAALKVQEALRAHTAQVARQVTAALEAEVRR
jgi:hypothetical protein